MLQKNNNNFHIGYTTTTLFRRLTYHLSENSAIKQYLVVKRNKCTNLLTTDERKIIKDNTKMI